jgi:hypothetical protein
MPKAGFIVGRVFFCVLAASMLGVAMLAVPTAAWASSSSCTKSSPCSLAFTADGQPQGTVVNKTITSAFNSQSGSIKVEILDASKHLNTNAKAAITITIGANPGNGTLSGTTTVTTSGGIASFSNLSINQTGFGYTLTATPSPGTGISSGTSNSFNIWSPFTTCSSTCSASSSGKTSTGTVTASEAASSDVLGIGIGVSYQCGGSYKPLSDAFGFEVLDSASGAPQNAQFTVVFRIQKSLVLSSGHPGASSWQICYASQTPFSAQPGTSGTATIGGLPFNTGLLPVCSKSQKSPCVQSRNKNNAGDVIITFLASGDPFGHP